MKKYEGCEGFYFVIANGMTDELWRRGKNLEKD